MNFRMRTEKTERNANSLGTKLTLGEKENRRGVEVERTILTVAHLVERLTCLVHFCDFAGITPISTDFQ